MSKKLKLYELPPSPNNMKVRIALGYKKLDYERLPLQFDDYPGDRSEIVKVSRQPLTPVLAHGDTVIFDSGAILRYLEANFPEAPTIFSGDIDTMRKIEEWEWMARTQLAKSISIIFMQAMSPDRDEDACRKASALMHELTGPIEGQLAQTPFLTGDHLTAADISAVPLIYYSMLPEGAASHPISRFMHENFELGADRDRTRSWVMKVLQNDRDFRA